MPFTNLPAGPVLSVLSTAAPISFASEIAQNPTFAASFELALDAGNTPEWFTGLPTDVQIYLHTYAAYAGAITTEKSGTSSPLTSTSSTATSKDPEASKPQSTVGPEITPVPTSNSAIPTSSATLSTSNSTTHGLNAGAKVGIGVGVSLGTVIIFMLGILLWRVDRPERVGTRSSPKIENKRRRKGLLYLQQKPELDAEGQMRNDIAANSVQEELEGEARRELPVNHTIQELRSEECAWELEAAGRSHNLAAIDEKGRDS